MPQSDHSVQPNLTSKGLENSRQVVEKRSKSPENNSEVGKVYLVGAGPGDPRLITVRGVECLEQADVVLYDGLANPRLLDFASQAEKISVGKHGIQPIWSQPDINHAMVRLAKAGKIVVRLKGGDPAVFAQVRSPLK
jgi:uroporphyrinogen III methyltransferase / synthase